jgi:peroxiredoxin
MKTTFLIFLAFLSLAGNLVVAQDLPKFSFYDANKKAFTQANLKVGQPVVVVYFDPDCDHCNKQAQLIQAEVSKFANAQMVWVAFPAAIEAITAFGKKYFPTQFGKNFFFLRDNDYTFDRSFGYSEAPSIYVYNKSRKQVKSYSKKEVAAAELAALLK